MSPSILWYYVDNEHEQNGPVDLQILQTLWKAKAITAQTLVWKEGQAEWLEIHQVPSLEQSLLGSKTLHGPETPVLELPENPAGNQQDPQAMVERIAAQDSILCPSSVDIHFRGPIRQHWTCFQTLDQLSYYYNTRTRELTWKKPQAFKTSEDSALDGQAWLWIRDSTRAYVPRRVIERHEHSETIDVVDLNGETSTIRLNQVTKFPLERHMLKAEADLVLLEHVNDASVIYNLTERFHQHEIYTWIGATNSVLISLNPFEQLPLYTPETMAEFQTPVLTCATRPHVFAIANGAYQAMQSTHGNQSILISGESGAGKTEAAKQVLNFLAEMAGSASNVEQKILNANPVLEAFGNAKTIRNNNSSRFGKWLELHFHPTKGIVKACIENYLLEKSRVVCLHQNERNYHIFYQLCQSPHATTYDIASPFTYRYLNQSDCIHLPDVDDGVAFQETMEAMEQLGFEALEKQWILQAVAAILHMGNVEFVADGDQGSEITSASLPCAEKAAKFLQVSVAAFTEAVCFNVLQIRDEDQKIKNTPKTAEEAVDALAKAIYDRLFKWLVEKINACCNVSASASAFIGVLDIFGFEIFESNSLEQLCINFTNEHLQNQFNQHTFEQEEHFYQAQGIQYDANTFQCPSNLHILESFTAKPYGLFHLLDTATRLPNGSDLKFLQAIQQHHPKLQISMSKHTFTIVHYAGQVPYQIQGFVEKNKDALKRGIYGLMASSSNSYFQQLFPSQSSNPRRIQTLGGQFRQQVTRLMKVVEATEPRYIRCIKPNTEKLPRVINGDLCIEQLRYAGIFESVAIRKTGFPFRLSHAEFRRRYGPICPEALSSPTVPRVQCKDLIQAIGIDQAQGIHVGVSHVLYRATHHRLLELLRNLTLETRAIPVQAIWRRALARIFRLKVQEATEYASIALRSNFTSLSAYDVALEEIARVLGAYHAMFGVETRAIAALKSQRKNLAQILALEHELKGLLEQDPNLVYMELLGAIEQAEKLAGFPSCEAQENLFREIQALAENCDAAKIEPKAKEALQRLERAELSALEEEASAIQYMSESVEEIAAILRLSEEQFVKLQFQKAVELKDEKRQINRAIRLKELYLQANGWMFDLDRFPQLRTPEEFAYAKYYGWSMNKDDLARGFLKFTTKPLHTSLTRLDPMQTKEAIKCFKDILGYMGIRKYPYPLTLAHALMQHAASGPEMQIEILLQLFKQIRQNPSLERKSKAWELVAIALSTFAPPDNFEHFVVRFLQQYHPTGGEAYMTAIHICQYEKKQITLPTTEEIPLLLKAFEASHRRNRSRFSVDENANTSFSRKTSQPLQSTQNLLEELDVLPSSDDIHSPFSKQPATSLPAVVSSPRAPEEELPPPPPPEDDAPPPPPEKQDVPPLPTRKPAVEATVLYEFQDAADESMLSISPGQVVVVLDQNDRDWWLVQLCTDARAEGWVPASYLALKG